MPFIRIDMAEGRSPEVHEELHARVAALVAEITGAPLSTVRTYITDIPVENWGIAGVSVAKKRRDAEAESP